MTSDTIADMLTRIRNANAANHRTCAVPASKMKVEIARVLKAEGFIEDYVLGEPGIGQLLTVTLKPRTQRGRALSGLRRISRPGLRVYARKTEIPRVLGGLGVAIISTSRGLMTGHAAQRAGLGGEVVAYVW
jgi:small subunit ribosomal protein S8